MIMQSTSWLDTRDPRLVELARMLPGIFIGTSIEMGKRLGWQSLNLRFQSAGRSELLRANDVDERSQLSILSFYYRGGCKQSFHPIPSSFWVDIAQSLMVDDYRAMFSRFWERFRPGHPGHPVYQKSVEQRSSTIPIAIHGDEGRGLAKVPVLVLAYQVMIPYSGENKLNSSK